MALSFNLWYVFLGTDDVNNAYNASRWMFRWPNINTKIGILSGTYSDSSKNNTLNFSIPYAPNELISKIAVSRNFLESAKTTIIGDSLGAF